MRAFIVSFRFLALFLCACGGRFEPQADAAPPDAAADAAADAHADAKITEAAAPDVAPPCPLECDGTCVGDGDPTNCGECGRSCAGQPCVQGACAGELVEPGLVMSLAVSGASLYYGLAVGSYGELHLAPTSGGASTTVAQGGDQVALDATTAYWLEANNVLSTPLGGGAITNVTTNVAGILHVAGATVYVGEGGVVWQAPIAGGAASTFATTIHFTDFAADDTDVYCGGDGLVRLSRTDASSTTLLPTSTFVSAMALDGDVIDYAASSEIESVPKSGGATTTIAFTGTGAGALAVDGASLYFIAGNALQRVPKTGGTVVTLTHDPIARAVLALDATYVYFATFKGVERTPK